MMWWNPDGTRRNLRLARVVCKIRGHTGSMAAVLEMVGHAEFWGHICCRCGEAYGFERHVEDEPPSLLYPSTTQYWRTP